VPTDIVFATGASVKVISGIEDISDALSGKRGTFETSRFAGFRGDEAVAGERVILNLETIAYAIEVPGP
jgi:hypothetical protein